MQLPFRGESKSHKFSKVPELLKGTYARIVKSASISPSHWEPTCFYFDTVTRQYAKTSDSRAESSNSTSNSGRRLRSELHYSGFQKPPGFQKMSEFRTGFSKHLRIFSKVYYARIVKSALISALGAKYWRDVRVGALPAPRFFRAPQSITM